jgi:CBS domain containing-hemolysin-like protein
VSIEDLVEEIVGNIEDEHDIDEIPPLKSDTFGYIASARTPIEDIEQHLGVTLNGRHNEDDVDTLGGLLFAMAGRVPPRGAIIRHPSGVDFEVLEATPRRIVKVRIVRRPDGGGDGVRLLEDLREVEGEAAGRAAASRDVEIASPKTLPPAAEAA